MITVEDHLERILRGVGPLEAYDQPIVESLGLPLHENFVAPTDLPRFANAGMDGRRSDLHEPPGRIIRYRLRA